MLTKNQHIFQGYGVTLNQAAAAFALLGVLTVGAWQLNLAARQIDMSSVPHSTSDFREGRTTNALEKQLDQKLPIRDALIATANGLRFLITGGAGEQVRVGKQDWLFLAEELRFDPAGADNLRARADLLARTALQLDAMGVKLVITLVPDKARVYPGHLIGGRYPEYNRLRYQDALNALRSRNIVAIDLLSPLESNATSSQVYYRTDTHWNQTGAKIAAETIASVVKQMKLGWEVTQFTTTTSTETIQRSGDLIRLMGLEDAPDAMRPKNDLETPSTTTQTDANSSGGLFGESDTPVVLSGTSYSLRANFHGYLQQALATKVLNVAKDGGGFLQATTEYLKDDSFRLAKPKLIIWEIPERFLLTKLEGEVTWLSNVGLTN